MTCRCKLSVKFHVTSVFACLCHFCSQIQWNYCILDEGHVIKNSKTKVLTRCLFLLSMFLRS